MPDQDPLLHAVSGVLGAPVTDATVVDTLDELRMTRIARLLHLKIARCGDPPLARSCLALLESLPEAAAARLLRAPALCELLRAGAPLDHLVVLLHSEHAFERGERSTTWTALGDVWLGGEPPGPAPVHAREDRLCAPRLACGLPLDLSLPPVLAYPHAGLQRPRAPTPVELAAAMALIDAAIERLADVYPLGHRLLCELTSNVVVRVDDDRSSECWGASSAMAIGRTVVANPQAVASPAALAELLLHEAVHCALDCAELAGSLVVLAPQAVATTVRSPWTGASLYAHAFIHASVVWAVLLEYWVRHRARHGDDPEVDARCRFIEHGFVACDVPATLAEIAGSLAPPAAGVIAGAWEAARRAASRG